MQPMTELEQTTPGTFWDAVVPGYRPVVMRGLVRHWPMVARSESGLVPVLEFLTAFDNGTPVDAVLARPSPSRALGYRPGLDGFNFLHDKRPLSSLFEQLLRYSHFADPPCLAVQSAVVADVLPGLAATHACPLLDAAPRIWIGNRATVPAHFDDSHNLACVAVGRRRFTLLPPQCAPLLYLGPPDHAPTGAPMSVVPDLHSADPVQFPLVQAALEQALVAELGPGDAIYIPPLWFHQVQALAPQLNILLNYWWRPPVAGRADNLHLAAMRLAMLALRHLPDAERDGWRALFGHYVFGAQGDALAHIPDAQRHLFGPIDADMDVAVRRDLRSRLEAG